MCVGDGELNFDEAQLGQQCSLEFGTWCAHVEGKLTGACGEDGICAQLCRLDADDCGGLECLDPFGSDVGICEPEAG